jgi:hypothetical protein
MSKDSRMNVCFNSTHTSYNKKLFDEYKEGLMYLAIAVETKKHPRNFDDYRVWYLEVNSSGEVVGIGVKEKKKIVESLFENYKEHGQSKWRAFQKEANETTPIELFDFVTRNENQNTHFGNLPTLNEFQKVLDTLQSNLEFKSIA